MKINPRTPNLLDDIDNLEKILNSSKVSHPANLLKMLEQLRMFSLPHWDLIFHFYVKIAGREPFTVENLLNYRSYLTKAVSQNIDGNAAGASLPYRDARGGSVTVNSSSDYRARVFLEKKVADFVKYTLGEPGSKQIDLHNFELLAFWFEFDQKTGEHLPYLAQVIWSKHQKVRAVAFQYLKMLIDSNPAAFEILIRALHSPVKSIREATWEVAIHIAQAHPKVLARNFARFSAAELNKLLLSSSNFSDSLVRQFHQLPEGRVKIFELLKKMKAYPESLQRIGLSSWNFTEAENERALLINELALLTASRIGTQWFHSFLVSSFQWTIKMTAPYVHELIERARPLAAAFIDNLVISLNHSSQWHLKELIENLGPNDVGYLKKHGLRIEENPISSEEKRNGTSPIFHEMPQGNETVTVEFLMMKSHQVSKTGEWIALFDLIKQAQDIPLAALVSIPLEFPQFRFLYFARLREMTLTERLQFLIDAQMHSLQPSARFKAAVAELIDRVQRAIEIYPEAELSQLVNDTAAPLPLRVQALSTVKLNGHALSTIQNSPTLDPELRYYLSDESEKTESTQRTTPSNETSDCTKELTNPQRANERPTFLSKVKQFIGIS